MLVKAVQLCGLLAEPDRLAAFAAVVLGARTVEQVATATGLPARQVTPALRAWHDDYVTLRRYLIDEELMARESGIYWRTG